MYIFSLSQIYDIKFDQQAWLNLMIRLLPTVLGQGGLDSVTHHHKWQAFGEIGQVFRLYDEVTHREACFRQ